jgi:hypothetical protein
LCYECEHPMAWHEPVLEADPAYDSDLIGALACKECSASHHRPDGFDRQWICFYPVRSSDAEAPK